MLGGLGGSWRLLLELLLKIRDISKTRKRNTIISIMLSAHHGTSFAALYLWNYGLLLLFKI